MNATRAEEKLGCGRERGTLSHYSNVSNESLPEKSSAMLKFSIAANLVLVAVCAVLLVSRKSMSDSPASKTEQIVVTNCVERVVEKQVEAQLSDAQKTAIEAAAIARFRSELNDNFPSKSKAAFLEYDETAISSFSKYYGPDYDRETEANKAEFKKQHEFLDKLGIGIDFVNNNLLKGKKP